MLSASFRYFGAEQGRRRTAPVERANLFPFGIEHDRRSVEVAVDMAYCQDLIPLPFDVDELFNDVTYIFGASLAP
jgi:hypothetical protein